jgi:hypothetical protein
MLFFPVVRLQRMRFSDLLPVLHVLHITPLCVCCNTRALLTLCLSCMYRHSPAGRARGDGCRHLAVPPLLRGGAPRGGLDVQQQHLHDKAWLQAHRYETQASTAGTCKLSVVVVWKR